MKLLNLFILIVLESAIVKAQNEFAITGQVADEKKLPVIGAVILLLNANDSTLVKAEATDDKGIFLFNQVKTGKYRVKSTMLGFSAHWSEIVETTQANKIELPVAILSPSSTSLKEVHITGIKPMIEVRPDKTVFNVENSINSTGSTALELLQKSPGVVVDQNDNISLKGRGGVMVQIDGKESKLTSSELADLLRSMQSSDVTAIELISNPSSKYDAAGTAGIINIKLKKNKNYGTNGSLTAGYAIGNYAKYNTSLTLNHRENNFNAYGTYSNNWGNRRGYINVDRIQNGQEYDQKSYTIRHGLSHNYKAGADFYVHPKHTIGVLVNGNYSDITRSTYSKTEIKNPNSNEINSTLNAQSINNALLNNINVDGNYHFADTLSHELDIDLFYGIYNNDGNSFQPNIYSYPGGNEDAYYYRNITPTTINIYTATVDYSQNLFMGKLGVGYKSAIVNTDNTFDFYNISNSIENLDTSRSNKFSYMEMIHACYLNYQRTIHKFEVQVGVRTEYTMSEGNLTSLISIKDNNVKRDYIDFFPSAGISYNYNPKNVFSFIFSSRIDRPNYQELNPFEFKLDELSYRKGNPFLNPQYTRKIELSHTYNYVLTTSAGYSHTRDFFAQITDTTEGNKSFLISRNLASEDVISLDISASHQLKKWWSIYINTGVRQQHYQADFGGGRKIDAEVVSYNLYLQNTFNFSKGLSFELSGWYGSPSIWGGSFKSESSGSLDIGLQKKLLNNKLSLKLNVTDIFETAHWRSESTFKIISIHANGGWESRQFRATLLWRFGNNQVKNVKQRTTDSESETKRVGTGD